MPPSSTPSARGRAQEGEAVAPPGGGSDVPVYTGRLVRSDVKAVCGGSPWMSGG